MSVVSAIQIWSGVVIRDISPIKEQLSQGTQQQEDVICRGSDQKNTFDCLMHVFLPFLIPKNSNNWSALVPHSNFLWCSNVDHYSLKKKFHITKLTQVLFFVVKRKVRSGMTFLARFSAEAEQVKLLL